MFQRNENRFNILNEKAKQEKAIEVVQVFLKFAKNQSFNWENYQQKNQILERFLPTKSFIIYVYQKEKKGTLTGLKLLGEGAT